MNSALLSFIWSNPDWKNILTEPPYCLSIKEDAEYPNFYIFSYNQIESDFSNPVVQDSRGVVIYINNPIVYIACNPFSKFFNYGEVNAAKVDWNTTEVLEKIDGSLIKLWYNIHDKKWMISTNGIIDSFKTTLPDNTGFFGDMVYSLLYSYKLDTSKLDHSSTYMFELVSPHNRVVVPYRNEDLYYLGSRNNKTGKEFHDHICDIFPQPKKYSFATFNDILKNIEELPFDQEGYVVVDKFYNRQKIKGLEYLKCHRIRGNTFTNKRAVELYFTNEVSEFLCYFPEYTPEIKKVERVINEIKNYINNKLEIINKTKFSSQKDFAIFIKDFKFTNFFFGYRSGKINNIDFFIKNILNIDYIKRELDNL